MTNFELGDMVKIVGPKNGDTTHWLDAYNHMVGKKGVVEAKDGDNFSRVRIKGGVFWFHASTLELEDEYGE